MNDGGRWLLSIGDCRLMMVSELHGDVCRPCRMCVSMYVCMHVCKYVCMYVCMYVCGMCYEMSFLLASRARFGVSHCHGSNIPGGGGG